MTCKELRQDLALAAAGALDSARLVQVREHCCHCAECAGRLEEFERIASTHARVAGELEALPVPSRSRLPAAPGRPSPLPIGSALGSVLRWLIPLGATAALAIALLRLPRTEVPHPAQVPTPVAAQAKTLTPLQPPSLAVYRSALNNPGTGSLDALLARHEQHLLPHTADAEMRVSQREL